MRAFGQEKHNLTETKEFYLQWGATTKKIKNM